MLKAIHEAQVHTSWINPDEGYDQATAAFVRGVLSDQNSAFLDDFVRFQEWIAHIGAFNSLTLQLLKLTAPGVPDVYQGTELWDFSLVDPDNRRPVDFELRSRLLSDMMTCDASPELTRELIEGKADGRIKLYLTQRTLEYRRANPELFANGDYAPLAASGAKASNVVAFARRLGEQEIIAVAPRLIGGLLQEKPNAPTGEIWGDTRLNLSSKHGRARYRNLLTGEQIDARTDDPGQGLNLAEVLSSFPVALLERHPDEPAADAQNEGSTQDPETETY
jgi:(1->4)-alpha-D-glucan 1-alpha-D-glucosylmutase